MKHYTRKKKNNKKMTRSMKYKKSAIIWILPVYGATKTRHFSLSATPVLHNTP